MHIKKIGWSDFLPIARTLGMWQDEHAARLAQWLEHSPYTRRVVGSNPTARTVNHSLLLVYLCYWKNEKTRD